MLTVEVQCVAFDYEDSGEFWTAEYSGWIGPIPAVGDEIDIGFDLDDEPQDQSFVVKSIVWFMDERRVLITARGKVDR